jgi:membrane dipeptidase
MTQIIDGHLDLAWNALSYDRDQTLTIDQLRQREAAMTGPGRGQAAVSLPEMRRGGVAVCLASLLARARPSDTPTQDPLRMDIDYANQGAAYAVAQGQLAYYRLLEQQGQIRIIRDVGALDDHWSRWQRPAPDAIEPDTHISQPGVHKAIGVVLSMEGADPIVEPGQVDHWWGQGLRAVSLAHYGPSAYACGTPRGPGDSGGLTLRGRELLKQLERVGVMLDLTHANDASFAEAAGLYGGPVYASHSNCRALVPGPRQLSDDQIRLIVERGGVIGCVLENSMLYAGWQTGSTDRRCVGLEAVADMIDHICQLAGGVHHAAIGSDLDGGFGIERCPHDLDTIADLTRIGPILVARGYGEDDIAAVLYGNWLRLLRRSLPSASLPDGDLT